MQWTDRLIASKQKGHLMFNRVSSVASLFGCCCPSAVVRFVIAVWINTINAMTTCRFWPHVCKEVFKGRFPSITKSHALIGIVSRLGIRFPAPVLHCQPRLKFWRLFTSRCAAVYCHSIRRNFATKTTTTLSFTASQFARVCKVFLSAVAIAKPDSNTSFGASLSFNHNKPSKSLTNKVAYSLRGSFRPQATTAFSASIFNSSSSSNSFFSTTTTAKPHCLLSFVFNTTNASQSIKCHAGNVYLFHLYFLLVFIVANRNRKAMKKVIFYA